MLKKYGKSEGLDSLQQAGIAQALVYSKSVNDFLII